MSGIATAIVVGGAITANQQDKASKRSVRAQERAAKAGIESQLAAEDRATERTQPFADIGLEAGGQLTNLLGDPNAGLEQINPVVNFLRDQGFAQISEQASARGVGAGAEMKELTQFNTDLTSTIVPQLQNQRFNQLFNVAGMGANAASGQATAALQTGANVSSLQNQIGQAQAQGAIQQGNTQAGLINTGINALGAFAGSGGGNAGGSRLPPGVSDTSHSTTPTF